MKKLLAIILTLTLAAGAAGCGGISREDDDVAHETVSFDFAEKSPIINDQYKIEMYEFVTSSKYLQLQSAAFEFVKAYIQADLTAAKELVYDSDNNESLKHFPTTNRSMDNLITYFISSVHHGYYEKADEQTEIASFRVTIIMIDHMISEDDPKRLDLDMEMVYVDDIFYMNGAEYYNKIWKVVFFDLNP